MRIRLNGEERDVDVGTTIGTLIEELGLGTDRVAVELNRELVPRALHVVTGLEDGDRVELVTLVGGG